MKAWCIDLAWEDRIIPVKNLEVCEYDEEDLAADMKIARVRRPELLTAAHGAPWTPWDRVVFTKEEEADLYLAQYRAVHALLPTMKFCEDRKLPALAYRTRNLVQTLMGHKLYTERDYLKDWKPGQHFNLHDRRSFVTVELKCITQNEPGFYRYNFKLVEASEQALSA